MNEDNNGLPVNPILEVLLESDKPEIQALSDKDWFRIENALRDDVEIQLRPKYRPSKVTISDQLIFLDIDRSVEGFEEIEKLTAEELAQGDICLIRKMTFGDILQLSDIGPQILSLFFDNDPQKVIGMNPEQIAFDVFSKAIGSKVQKGMSIIGNEVLERLAELMVIVPDIETARLLYKRRVKVAELEKSCGGYTHMTAEDLIDLGGISGVDGVRKVVAVNAHFFTHVQSILPENVRQGLGTLNGMITSGIQMGITQGSKMG